MAPTSPSGASASLMTPTPATPAESDAVHIGVAGRTYTYLPAITEWMRDADELDPRTELIVSSCAKTFGSFYNGARRYFCLEPLDY